LLDLDPDEMLRTFRFVNVLDRFPGKGDSSNPRGDAWPRVKARKEFRRRIVPIVAKMFADLPTKQLPYVVLLGTNVRDAAGDRDLVHDGFFRWRTWYGSPRRKFIAHIAVVPHPSGVARWWNDLENVRTAEKFFRSPLFRRTI
jgi:hypothetical protein